MTSFSGIIGFVIGFIAGGAFVWFLLRKKDSFLLIQNQLNNIADILDKKLSESSKTMQNQISESNRLIKDITTQITEVKETNKQVANFSLQIKNLQDILGNPKQRGILGEYFLEMVLKNVLPPALFQMQYRFTSGEAVDAAVFVGTGSSRKILPVDSKFSLANYNRWVKESNPTERDSLEKSFVQDIKTRIDETSKYIKLDENTMDFAFMFIPSEAIYYDLLANKVGTSSEQNLIEYAFKKGVILVSPTSFTAYLQTVLQGLRALKIEENAKEIMKRVETLGKYLVQYDQYMKKMGDTLGTTVGHYNLAYKELQKIDKNIVKITGESASIEPIAIERPTHREDELL